MWLYSSPLEALVVVVITGIDRTVISYININSLVLCSLLCSKFRLQINNLTKSLQFGGVG